MWVTRNLDRARRRLRPAPPTSTGASEPASVEDLAVSLVRTELDRLVATISTSLEASAARPDSPARLAGALQAAIADVDGTGFAEVTRSPAGLYTPEYWHIRVEGADPRTRDAICRLLAGGRMG